MPKKGKKGGKGKKKGKKKTKAKGPANADVIVQRLLKCYERNCVVTESQMCLTIKKALQACIENGAILTRFILEAVRVEKEGDIPVLLEPLLAALRQERYTYIKDLHIWKYPMSYENTATLALLLEKPFYPIRQLEMMDCLLEADSALRLSRTFKMTEVLTTINLDYNEFGDEGCKNLCKGLENNTTILSLSLCFCDLGVDSGRYLGNIVSTTALRELYLDGNNLLCEGAIEIIKLCAEQAEYEAYQRAEELQKKAEEEAAKLQRDHGDFESMMSGMEKESKSRFGSAVSGESGKDEKSDTAEGTEEKKKKKKGKKGKKKKKKEPPPPPRVGPWIQKLHLADNGIDNLQFGSKFTPLICIRIFKKLLMYSDCFEELDLEDNLIGDLAGREIIEALEYRKEEKLSGVKLKATHRLSAETYSALAKLGTGLKKKKKKGKKKKK
ncbi:hypothetical protein ACJMK2_018649 [Sinanodonta woodiana]|uniref:Uncharacterized protein n=1 Tax=Sinanodonta woodiana TaxID=1069815 RepID=A0ABD3UFP7_SINWO